MIALQLFRLSYVVLLSETIIEFRELQLLNAQLPIEDTE